MAKGYNPLRRRSSDPIPGRNFSETNSNSVPSSTRVNMNLLRSGLTLPINHMAIPVNIVPSSGEDVEICGRFLLQHFIQEELVHQGIPDEILEVENPPPDVFGDVGPEMLYGDGDVRAESPAFLSTPDGYKNKYFEEIGASIRNIADEFAVSHERKKIQQQADEVDLSHINYSAFQHMLMELFRDGINKYRIVSLFFFCSDVLVRCIKNELHRLGSKLFFWALQYLVNNVCKWVRDHGGWGKVFSQMYAHVYKFTVFCAAAMAITCGYLYIRKSI